MIETLNMVDVSQGELESVEGGDCGATTIIYCIVGRELVRRLLGWLGFL